MRKLLSIELAVAVTAVTMAITPSAAVQTSPEPMRASHTRLAQVPGTPPVSTRRTVNLNEQDRHIIREIVLKDPKVEKAADNIAVSIGGAVPQGVHLKPVPDDVTRKVPQLKNNTFFVTGEEVVIVEPKDNTVAEIVK
jgi:hypothetical protein